MHKTTTNLMVKSGVIVQQRALIYQQYLQHNRHLIKKKPKGLKTLSYILVQMEDL